MDNITITLKNIAGYEEEKKLAASIIKMLKNYQDYQKFGAILAKGAIISVNNCVGKTLFSLAIAGEIGRNVYVFDPTKETTDGSDDKANYKKKIKALYKEAKQNTPSIVILDEIEQILPGRHFVSDTSRGVLQAILTEIDGTENSEGVFTIATCNNRDELPNPLYRSGRLEKKIEIAEPTFKDRKEILEMYLEGKTLLSDVDSKILAKKTKGMTGADLKRLVNDTLILCIGEEKRMATMKDFDNTISTIRIGGVKKKLESKADTSRVCYHEIGHFLANHVIYGTTPEISIYKQNGINGYVPTLHNFFMDDEEDRQAEADRDYKSLSEMKQDIVICLAGMAAEEVFCQEKSEGGYGDLRQAKNKCEMILAFGDGDFNYIRPIDDSISDAQLNLIEGRIKEMLKEAYDKALNIVKENQRLGEFIHRKLMDEYFLSEEDIVVLLKEFKG